MVNPDCPEHGHEALPVVAVAGSTLGYQVERTAAHAALAGVEKMKAGAAEALAAGALDEEETHALEEAAHTITDLFDRLDSERKRWGA